VSRETIAEKAVRLLTSGCLLVERLDDHGLHGVAAAGDG
jgi:hypothetical protein